MFDDDMPCRAMPCRAVPWCSVVWCCVAWCCVVWCGVVWCGVVCRAVPCRGVVWCSVVWLGMVRYMMYSSVWYCVVWSLCCRKVFRKLVTENYPTELQHTEAISSTMHIVFSPSHFTSTQNTYDWLELPDSGLQTSVGNYRDRWSSAIFSKGTVCIYVRALHSSDRVNSRFFMKCVNPSVNRHRWAR